LDCHQLRPKDLQADEAGMVLDQSHAPFKPLFESSFMALGYRDSICHDDHVGALFGNQPSAFSDQVGPNL
jgi:hypothetical protein